MTPALAQRELALAGVALLCVVVALALGSSSSGGERRDPLPQPAADDGGTWYRALAGPAAGRYGRRSDCGQVIRPTTLGVAHPVLPCGAKIFISFGGNEVLTQIVDHGPRGPGRDFDVTPALAARLGLRGTQPIRWTYARAP